METLNIHPQLLLFLSCLLSGLAAAFTPHSSKCAPGIQSAGVTVPKGDIKIEYGNPLEIFCVLDSNLTNANASSLVFYYNEERFPKEYMTVVNETTLRLYVKKPAINNSLVSCKLRMKNGEREQGVCLNYVYVGTKPKEVKNFTCVSYNWESLNCSWIPDKNPVRTTYKLTFSLKPKTRMVYACPGNTDVDHNYCLWNSTTTPPHRMPYETYYFKLTGSNIFGNITTTYQIDHFAVVLPRKPENLSLIESTSSSITISWSLPLALKEFPGGIRSKVLYQSYYDAQPFWQEANMDNLIVNGTGHYILNITGLKYPHTLYDIRVYLKSNRAEDSDKWWSEPTWIFLSTKPAVPGMPPKTDMGSFDSTARAYEPDFRKIYLYWQQIPKSQENGENFGYNVSSIEEEVNGVLYQRHEVPEIHKTYALFKKMTYNKYIFKIVSFNKEGVSKSHSTIIVPSKDKSPSEPVSFTKIAYDHGVYELSWNAPPRDYSSDRNNIKSYTIFWCDNKNDIPYQCNGVLNWTRVDANVTEKNITVPDDKIFQFAISANTAYSSSGMVWADCTVWKDQERGKLKNLWINRIDSTSMELKWKLDCLRSRSISGFEVTYCPIVGPQDSNCKEGNFERKSFTGDHSTAHYTISNLRPYTTYKVFLAVVTKQGSLIKSDPLQNTTLEAVPDGPPEELRAVEVGNTSVTLTWSPPLSLNGVLRHYRIYLNNSLSIRVDKQHALNKTFAVKYTLSGLLSYEFYVVRVVACTVACSNQSADLLVRTKIGMPGVLSIPSVSYFNKTDLNITWTPLKYNRGGRNEYYQIQIEILSSQNDVINATVRNYNNSGGSEVGGGRGGLLGIVTPGCEGDSDSAHVYKVRVRAVNQGEDGVTEFFGPWSQPSTGFCMVSSISTITFPYVAIVTLTGIAVIILFMAVAYVTKCIWKRCKAMQNIRVKLPPQLELDIYKGEVIDLPMSQHIPHEKQPPLNSDNHDTPPPNQPLLAEKKAEKEELTESSGEDGGEETGCVIVGGLGGGGGGGGVCGGDRDSSGCGSGHESVSSSITAGTHITDSGTEADERAEDVFGESPRREVYPRQRNISRSGGGGGGGSGADGYCILAQAPSGYVSLPPTSGYVKHDWTPNGGLKGYEGTAPSSLSPPNLP